jgi:uncharacterized protein YqgC (DUF456 family)
MVLALLAIPFGLPGLWVMVGIVAVGLAVGEVPLGIFVVLAGLAVAAELAEWVSVDRLGRRFGGSTRTFWGAIIGGVIGVIVGAPVPVAGSLVGAFAGTLIGAVAATWLETRQVRGSLRAGWGALLGRVVAVSVKIFAALVILVIGGGALILS